MDNPTPSYIIEAHTHSSDNEEISSSKMGGCFFCLSTFASNEVEWQELYDGMKIALCPKCGIDAVLGDKCGYNLTPSFLKEMNQYWF